LNFSALYRKASLAVNARDNTPPPPPQKMKNLQKEKAMNPGIQFMLNHYSQLLKATLLSSPNPVVLFNSPFQL
jgi:hypothetical protein